MLHAYTEGSAAKKYGFPSFDGDEPATDITSWAETAEADALSSEIANCREWALRFPNFTRVVRLLEAVQVRRSRSSLLSRLVNLEALKNRVAQLVTR